MTARFSRHAEELLRDSAKWGSLLAAVIFAVGYATDTHQNFMLTPHLAAYTFFITLTFVGYAIAWKARYELAGSVLAVVSAVFAYFIVCEPGDTLPGPFLLAVAAPAALHLAAVAWHRSAVTSRRRRRDAVGSA